MNVSKISESDLIITPEGCIYHLDLHPDELADTVITVGDPDRVAMVSKHFDKIEVKKQHREFITHTGLYKGQRITVISTGIGLGNVDVVMNELDALVNVNFATREVKSELKSLRIIRIGTCGGLHESVALDDFVVSHYGVSMGNILQAYKYELEEDELDLEYALRKHLRLTNEHYEMASIRGDEALIDLFKQDCHEGITITCPGFYASQGRQVRAQLAIPDMLGMLHNFKYKQYNVCNFEMETAAIYGFGHIFNHQCCSLSTVVADRVRHEFSSQAEQAMAELIEYTLTSIS